MVKKITKYENYEDYRTYFSLIPDELDNLTYHKLVMSSKWKRHRGFDQLLCDHVYFRFCPDCPQYECEKRGF